MPERLPRTRAALAEWRRFFGRHYRRYASIGLAQAAVGALAGDGLTIPLLLALGCPPALATVVGVLPAAGAIAQLSVPGLLRRSGGNLRRVTLAILAVGELRGFALAAITALAAARAIPAGAAIAGIATVMGLGGAAGMIGGTNLFAWYGAVLAEDERRFVAPRVMALAMGVGATLLLPIALVVDGAIRAVGLSVYGAVFAASGLAGLAELVLVGRLRNPGRVLVADDGGPPVAQPPELRHFLRTMAFTAFGAGLGPYLSIYAISVLALPAGFAVLLSALSSAASLVTSTLVGGWLHRGSSSRLLRVTFVIRGGSMLLGPLAFPGNPLAWLVLCVIAVTVNAGYAAGTIAANERLQRLTHGSRQLIAAQGRYVAGTSLGVTGGQTLGGAILAATPAGYPVFAALFLVSGTVRIGLAPTVEVSESWRSTTAAWRVDELMSGQPPSPLAAPPEPGTEPGAPFPVAADTAAETERPPDTDPAQEPRSPIGPADQLDPNG